MAAAITLASTTAEQQALELPAKLADAIAAYSAANPTANLKGLSVTKSVNLNTNRATFSIVVPLVVTNSIDGGLEFDAEAVMA